jgi:hypothetical protein
METITGVMPTVSLLAIAQQTFSLLTTCRILSVVRCSTWAPALILMENRSGHQPVSANNVQSLGDVVQAGAESSYHGWPPRQDSADISEGDEESDAELNSDDAYVDVPVDSGLESYDAYGNVPVQRLVLLRT